MLVCQIEEWISRKGTLLQKTKDELKHLSQVSNLLMINKENILEKGTLEEICPSLNVLQIKTILEFYKIDQYSQDEIPHRAIEKLSDLSVKQKLDASRDVKLDTNFIYKFENFCPS